MTVINYVDADDIMREKLNKMKHLGGDNTISYYSFLRPDRL